MVKSEFVTVLDTMAADIGASPSAKEASGPDLGLGLLEGCRCGLNQPINLGGRPRLKRVLKPSSSPGPQLTATLRCYNTGTNADNVGAVCRDINRVERARTLHDR